MNGPSTAVVPFFRVSRRVKSTTYRCREQFCHFVVVSMKADTRDVRMIVLARHLVDAHETGPLARVTVP